MPIYVFKCPNCLDEREEAMKWEEAQEARLECEACKIPLQRQITKAHFVLKGTGFHVNDYGKG